MTTFDFNNQWGSMPGMWNNNFDFTPTWQTPSGTAEKTSSSNRKNETYEERKARLEKEKEAAILKQKETAALKELEEAKKPQLKELEKMLEESKKGISQIESNKKSDGSSSVVVKRKDQGFWGKAGRWVSNAGTAIVNMGKSFVGYDSKTGKWDAGKCLKNTAIAAAAIGACFIPVVGPFIGAGLAVAGVGMGAVSVAKGVKNLKKAERTGNDAAIDKAQQEIMGGAFVAATSAVGLKGMGSGFRTGAATAAKASSAAERTGVIGKIGQSISNAGRDMTVNAWRATKTAASNDMAAVASNGFFKTWGSKISSSYKGFNDAETRYNNNRAEINSKLDSRLSKVDSDIQSMRQLQQQNGSLTTAEQQRLALLKEERYLLQNNRNELNNYFGTNTREKSLYDGLKASNAGTKAAKRVANRSASSRPDVIQGQKIPKEELQSFYTRIMKEQNQYVKDLNKLIKAKEDKMRLLAKHQDDNMIELAQYVPNPNVKRHWWKVGDWRKTDYQLAIGGKNSGHYGELSKVLLTSPTTVVPKAIGVVDPIYSTPFMFGQDMTAEEVEETLKALNAQKKQIEENMAAIKNIKTVDEWNALQAQAQQAQQASAETQKTDEAATK